MSRSNSNTRLFLGFMGILTLSLVGFDNKKVTENLFAPGIAVVLQGKSYNFLGEEEGCEYVQYEIYVRNTSTNGEILENLIINNPTDAQFNLDMDFLKGDDNLNGLLDMGETWEYRAYRPIDESLYPDAKIQSQITVTADVVGQLGVAAFDDSHPTSFADGAENQTEIPIPCISGISIITTKHQTKDTGGQDGGCTAIEYTIEVTHNGDPADSFSNSELRDEKGNNIFNLVSGDEGIPDRLEPGETWVYSVIYPITFDEILSGQAERQFYFETELNEAFPIVYGADISDYISPDEDRPTVTDLSHCVPEIALIKTATPNIHCTQIDYSFIVTNEGTKDVTGVLLSDKDNPGLVINGPTGDAGNDGVLGLDETWEYTATYVISQTELDDGEVSNTATVEADVIEFPGMTISDESHPDDIALDGPTITNLSGCEPGIAITKTGEVDNDCANINYEFTVTNQGNKILESVVVTDNGLVINGPNGDDNLDGELDFNEKWTYTATHAITTTDLIQGEVENQAQVEANVVGEPAQIITDLSHPTDVDGDADTITDISSCVPGIAITMEGSLNPNCADIGCTFTVTNQGNQDLESIVVTYNDLVGLIIEGPNGDEGNDGILGGTEIWTYTASYPIQQADFDNGTVSGTSSVDAHVASIPQLTVFDLSHPFDIALDGPTTTDIAACQDPKLGLIKEASLADIDQDGCHESIFYEFTVTNLGNISLNNLLLEDPLFQNAIAGPTNESDMDNDGVLSPGEIWNYETYYGISAQNITDGNVINQAVVAGWTPYNLAVADYSDDDTYAEDDPTYIDIDGACEIVSAGIGFIKQGILSDQNNDECPENIKYTFQIKNLGGEALENVTIEDNMLDAEAIQGPNSGDMNSNNLLDVGEEWIYEALYPISDTDLEKEVVENQAAVTAQSTFTLMQVFDFSDDDEYGENEPTITSVIGACPSGDPVDDDPSDGNPIDPDFEVFTGITPNGDDINDHFRINGIQKYPNNTLKIFNRWGVLVYEAEGYGIGSNLFLGISEGRATVSEKETLPSGTYFYTLKFEGVNPGKQDYSGYLYINRD